MIFKSAGSRMCDTWIYPQQGRYHLFWLADSRGGTDWNCIEMAESEDLLHWRQTGTAVERAADAESWMGTGRTWRAGEQFVMNFSEFRSGMIEEVHFCVSDDLRHWKRLGADMASHSDARWYATRLDQVEEEFVRWDLICPVYGPDGQVRRAVATSHGRGTPSGRHYVIGQLTSPDGLHWQTVAPAGEVTFPIGDISGHACLGTRHYVFVSIWENWGPRYDPFTTGQQGNGMWYFVADHADGPYRQPPHDNLLHGQRCENPPAHFGAPFKHEGRWLWNHGCVDTTGHNWLGPVKELVEVRPGELALIYYPANDGLKQAPLWAGQEAPAPRYLSAHGRLCSQWNFDGGVVRGRSDAATGLAVWQALLEAGDGLIVEADLTIVGDGYAGIFAGGDAADATNGLVCVLAPKGRGMVGYASMGRQCPRLTLVEDFAWPPFVGKVIRLRAIMRHTFMELYADDRLVRTMRMNAGHLFCGAFGIWIDQCEAHVSNVHAWTWKL